MVIKRLFFILLAETCKGINWLVKFLMRLETVLLLSICKSFLMVKHTYLLSFQVLYMRFLCRDFSDNLLYGDIPFSISKLKQLDTLYVLYYFTFFFFSPDFKVPSFVFLCFFLVDFSEPFNLRMY